MKFYFGLMCCFVVFLVVFFSGIIIPAPVSKKSEIEPEKQEKQEKYEKQEKIQKVSPTQERKRIKKDYKSLLGIISKIKKELHALKMKYKQLDSMRPLAGRKKIGWRWDYESDDIVRPLTTLPLRRRREPITYIYHDNERIIAEKNIVLQKIKEKEAELDEMICKKKELQKEYKVYKKPKKKI